MIQTRIDSNWPEVQKEMLARIQAGGKTRVDFINNAEYAAPLHAKRGYAVFSPAMLLRTINQRIRSAIKKNGGYLEPDKYRLAIHAGAIAAIDYHRQTSFAFGRRPPVRAGEGDRAAHPGGWADVYGLLANSYFYRIDGGKINREDEWAEGKQSAKARKRAKRPIA